MIILCASLCSIMSMLISIIFQVKGAVAACPAGVALLMHVSIFSYLVSIIEYIDILVLFYLINKNGRHMYNS